MAEEGAAGAAMPAEEAPVVQLNVRVSTQIAAALDTYVGQYRGVTKGQIVERGLRHVLGLDGETSLEERVAALEEQIGPLVRAAETAGAI